MAARRSPEESGMKQIVRRATAERDAPSFIPS